MARCDEHAELFDFTSCLTEELRHQTDKNRRIPLLFALIRRLEEKPEESEKVRALIDEVSRLRPNDTDLVWERWRFHCRSDAKERLKALSELKGVLEFPDDIVHAHMAASEILGEHLGDHARALKEIDTVRKIAPERSEALLTSAKIRAAAGRPISEWAGDLEIFVDNITDPRVRAALFFELAELRRTSGAEPEEVISLLSRALSLSGADWTVLDGVLRSAEKMEVAKLIEASVEKIAEAALETEEESDADKPKGHGFLGFEHGEEIAGAYFWLLAGIRERLLKDKETALQAIERAQALLPKNRLLRLERARLLDAVGRSEDAFAAVPEDASFLELAIFAYAAGKYEEASYLASLDREHASRESANGEKAEVQDALQNDSVSLFSEVAFESLTADPAAPPLFAPPSVLHYWFEGRPDHEDAGKVAEALRDEVSSTSVVRLFLEENAPPDSPIVDVVDSRRPEPWSFALSALLGDESERSLAFEDWANTVSDPILKSTLLHMAASLQKKEIAEETARDRLSKDRAALLQDRAALLEDRAELYAREFSCSHDVSKLDALDETNPEERLIGGVERALRLSCESFDHAAATEILKAAAAEHPDEPAVRWLLFDVALRKRDFPLAAETLFTLVSISGDDAKKMLLCLGELNLLQNRDLKTALSCFDEAERQNGDENGRARIDRLLALHLLNEDEAIQRALKESGVRKKNAENSFFDWEDEEEDCGLQAQALLEGKDNLPIHLSVVKTLSAFENDKPAFANDEPASQDAEKRGASLGVAASGLRQLASGLSDDGQSLAFLAAAALLDGRFDTVKTGAQLDAAEPLANLDPVDERLVRLADKSLFDKGLTESAQAEARRIKSSDLFEWVDWMLCAAEAAHEIDGPKRALEIVREASAAAPDHPGLLEAEVLFANLCGEYEEAADTRGRLARFYVSKDEKVHQLVQAALILFDKLQDAKGARNILNEAKRRNPGHAEANEVWQYILEAASDSEEGHARREKSESFKASVESEERKIARLIGLNQLDAAMEAVNKLLIRQPDRLSAHRTRLDLLTRTKQWANAVAAAEAYFNAATHKEERRSIAFRAAAIADDVLKDPPLAIAWMQRLREVGDSFPEADKRIREIAVRAGIALDDDGFFEEDSPKDDNILPEEGK